MQNTNQTMLNDDAIQTEITSLKITATYSAEDNKLRFRTTDNIRLSTELFAIARSYGFSYAPKLKLFFAPSWSPQREDFCIVLAGEITAEETTLVERAEMKVERLEALAVKRAGQADSYRDAANKISEQFAGGQPILVGHHSENKARKEESRMKKAIANAIKASEAVNYWGYRADGVERHANRNARSDVRAGRIKTLLADLRSRQRSINQANKSLTVWKKVEATQDLDMKRKAAIHYSGSYEFGKNLGSKSIYSQLTDGLITVDDAIESYIAFNEFEASSPTTLRWISHLLNRLAYERDELGVTSRFDGDLTTVILQGFARENGAEKPIATATENGFKLVSSVPLPYHIAQGKELTLTSDEWRDFMQSIGYQVVIKTRNTATKAANPLINPTQEQAQKLQDLWNAKKAGSRYGEASETRTMLQSVYKQNSSPNGHLFTISLDEEGNRIRSRADLNKAVCRVRMCVGNSIGAADRVVIIGDKAKSVFPLNFEILTAVPAAMEA